MSFSSTEDFDEDSCERSDVVLAEGDKAPFGRKCSGMGEGVADALGVPRTRP